MFMDLLFHAVHHDMPPSCKNLFCSAIHQLELAKQALDDFELNMLESPKASTLHADTGSRVLEGLPSRAHAAAMLAVQNKNPAEVMRILTEGFHVPALRSELRARSFIYELDLFRKIVWQVGHAEPRISARIESRLARFDAAVPGLKNVRDTLAHFDERSRGLAYSKPLNPISHQTSGEPLNLGLRMEGNSYGGQVKTGKFEAVVIDANAIAAGEQLIRVSIAIFPELPSLQPAIQNYRNGIVG